MPPRSARLLPPLQRPKALLLAFAAAAVAVAAAGKIVVQVVAAALVVRRLWRGALGATICVKWVLPRRNSVNTFTGNMKIALLGPLKTAWDLRSRIIASQAA